MTRVDFYIIHEKTGRDRDRFVCKLVGKAWQEQHRVYVHTGSQAQTNAIDDLLWTFRDISFLPHEQVINGHAAETRVLIGHTDPPEAHDDVMVNLTHPVPHFFEQFDRVLEVIDQAPENKKVGRQRYRYYIEHGHTPNTHDIGQDNG